jgi:hypothetical protein
MWTALSIVVHNAACRHTQTAGEPCSSSPQFLLDGHFARLQLATEQADVPTLLLLPMSYSNVTSVIST